VLVRAWYLCFEIFGLPEKVQRTLQNTSGEDIPRGMRPWHQIAGGFSAVYALTWP